MVAFKCCICGRLIDNDGYDAQPYKRGKCCSSCNFKYVIQSKKNFNLKRRKY